MSRTTWRLPLVLAVCLSGCLPPVMHGPEVRSGWRGLVAAGVGLGPEAVDDPQSVTPLLLGGVARGWVGESAAFSVGAQTPLVPYARTLLFAGSVDLYVQPDRSLPLGAGVVGSWSVLMPYAQLGLGADGALYTTQGIAFAGQELEEGTYWVPGIAFRQARPDDSRAATVWLTGGVRLDAREPDALATVGVVFDFGARR